MKKLLTAESGKATRIRSGAEAVEMGIKGGKASGEARRKKAMVGDIVIEEALKLVGIGKDKMPYLQKSIKEMQDIIEQIPDPQVKVELTFKYLEMVGKFAGSFVQKNAQTDADGNNIDIQICKFELKDDKITE